VQLKLQLQQEVAATDQKAVDYVLGGDNEWVEIETSLNAAEKAGQYDQIAVLHDRMDVIDGYTARARAQQMLAGLGFAQDDFNKSLRSFSGGWRIRLNLARTLMAPSDLLLLDEPTNHLDLDAILWLSTWIRHYQGSMILISHDREFLDETIENIAYLYRQTIECSRVGRGMDSWRNHFPSRNDQFLLSFRRSKGIILR